MEMDGSILEGGGQILRNCVAYATILGLRVEIKNIRASRPKPGLRPQHLTGLKLAADMCDAETSGLEVDSTEVSFRGRGIQQGCFVGSIPTAGACTLLAQISIPIALFAPGATSFVLKGGTNVAYSPPVEYLKWVLLPVLGKFGIHGVEVECVRKGFQAGGGEVHLRVQPGFTLTGATLDDRGAITRCTAFLTGFCTEGFEEELKSGVAALAWDHGSIAVELDTVRVPKDKGAVQLLFVVESANGFRIGSSAMGSSKKTGGKLVTAAFNRLRQQLDKEICADEYLQDQVILFMALAEGTSRMRCGDITLHTQTAMHFASLMAGAEFHVEKLEPGVNIVTCKGMPSKNVSIIDSRDPQLEETA